MVVSVMVATVPLDSLTNLGATGARGCAPAVGGFSTSLSGDAGSAGEGFSAIGGRQVRRRTLATRGYILALRIIVQWFTGL